MNKLENAIERRHNAAHFIALTRCTELSARYCLSTFPVISQLPSSR